MNWLIYRISKFLKNRYNYFKISFNSLLNKILYFKSVGTFAAFAKYFALTILLLPERKFKNLGAMQARPTLRSIFYASTGMLLNSNHLGSVFAIPKNKQNLTHRMEKEVINWVKKIFKITDKNVEGYITSGGTESNLFIMWSARDFLNQKKSSKCCVIVSCLTHYSILKDASMLNIQPVYTPINKNTWSIDTTRLEETINQLHHQGIQNIMLPVTLGYSSTGTCDSLEDIVLVLKKSCSKNEMNYIIWIDAAGQGLPMAFLRQNFKPLFHKEVYAINVDFHKLGSSPIPGGVAIFRKKLRTAIQQSVGILSEIDVTVSGSRPGFAALALWANVFTRSSDSWRQDYTRCEKEKNKFVKQFCKYFPKKNILCTPHTLTCAIIIDKDFIQLPKSIEEKYSLYLCSVSINNQNQKFQHYKIHFMPQTNSKIYNEFINDILKSQNRYDQK